MSTYEVSVPVVVKIVDGEIVKTFIDPGWGGYFSDVQDAAGVFDPQVGEWGTETDDCDQLARLAQDHVRALLPIDSRERLEAVISSVERHLSSDDVYDSSIEYDLLVEMVKSTKAVLKSLTDS